MATYASGGTPVDVPPEQHLLTSLWARAAAGDESEILRARDGAGWQGTTWRQLGDRVRSVAAGLIASGVQPGDRVALMAATSPEWTVTDLAILAAGGVTVPIYETSSLDQCETILADSGARLAITQSADLAKTLDTARERAPELGEVLVLADAALDTLAERGGDAERAEVDARSAALGGEHLFSLIYTSGTTGTPKGCVLTHHNMLWTVRQSQVRLDPMLGERDSTLLFLPLAHVFMRMVQYLCLESNVTIGYARSLETIAEDLEGFKPTFLFTVPRVLEKVYANAERKAQGAKAKVFAQAAATARRWSEETTERGGPGLATRVQHALFDRLVYGKLRHALGGRLGYCISGGAPLPVHLGRFFHGTGISVLEGYGLTETTAPAAVNTPDALRFGTVGRPLPGVELRIADDGEVLIKGGNIFQGYHNDEEMTRAAFNDEGWFLSGDLGELDDDGFLRITGRKKEVIVTAVGKNVAPTLLEERLRTHRLISQAMVVGDNRPFIAALLTLDPEELSAFADSRGLSGTPAELAADPAVRAELDKAVEYANAAVSRAESIRKYAVLERDFSQEEGELSLKLSVRRAVVAEHYAEQIEQLYQRPEGTGAGR